MLGVHIVVYQPYPNANRTLMGVPERNSMSTAWVTD